MLRQSGNECGSCGIVAVSGMNPNCLPSRLPFSVKRSSSHSKYFVDKERQAKWGNVIYRMSQKGFLWDASKNCCFLCFKKQANYLSVAKTNMSIDKLIPLLFFFVN